MYEEPEVAPSHYSGPQPATEAVSSEPGLRHRKDLLQFYKKI